MSEREKRLEDALQKSKEVIVELQAAVGQLKTPPLTYATVVRTGNVSVVQRPAKKADFVPGRKVLVSLEKLRDYGLVHQSGEVVEPRKNTVIVRMMQGVNAEIAMDDLHVEDPIEDSMPTVTVSAQGKISEVVQPTGMELEEGMIVTLNVMGAIVSSSTLKQYGKSAVVKRPMDDGLCEILESDGSRVVFVAKSINNLEKGDVVFLDAEGLVVLENHKQESNEFTVESHMDVKWEKIGGLKELKAQVHEMVELPHQNPEVFRFYNKTPAKGILLYGPPGCGKTMVAKAIATSLANLYGGNLTESGFLYVKGPEILNPYVGMTEQTIRSLFERARKHKAKTGYPATIFIDEADAVLHKRGTGISSDVDKTIVPMFLTEMDGLVDSAAFIILATNRADTLDPAVMRDGRIDAKVRVNRPDLEAGKEIISINLGQTVVKDGQREALVEFIAESIYTSELRKTVSGAMIANVVGETISEAIRREIAAKQKPAGIVLEDAEKAIKKLKKRETEITREVSFEDVHHPAIEEIPL